MEQGPTPLDYASQLRPHRGGLILTLGILGLTVCFPCAIVAWVLGHGDLKSMQSGVMDPSGMGMTRAGQICGIISVILNAVVLVMIFVMFVAFFAFAATGAASGL